MSSKYVGDFSPGDIVDFTFNTIAADGTLTVLTGSPAIAVYKDNGTTETTTGLTLTASFDSKTGLNFVHIDTSADTTNFVNGSNYTVVLTAGTVDSVSVVAYACGTFSIGRNMANYGITDQGVAQAATSTTLTLRSVASFADNVLAGATLMAFGSTQGYWQQREIVSNVGSTDVVTVSPAWGVTPSGTVKYKLFGTPPQATANPVDVNVVQWLGATAPQNTGDTFALIGTAGVNLTAIATAAVQAAIKAKTDLLTSQVAGTIDANVTRVNEILVNGSGTSNSPWGP